MFTLDSLLDFGSVEPWKDEPQLLTGKQSVDDCKYKSTLSDERSVSNERLDPCKGSGKVTDQSFIKSKPPLPPITGLIPGIRRPKIQYEEPLGFSELKPHKRLKGKLDSLRIKICYSSALSLIKTS